MPPCKPLNRWHYPYGAVVGGENDVPHFAFQGVGGFELVQHQFLYLSV